MGGFIVKISYNKQILIADLAYRIFVLKNQAQIGKTNLKILQNEVKP